MLSGPFLINSNCGNGVYIIKFQMAARNKKLREVSYREFKPLV